MTSLTSNKTPLLSPQVPAKFCCWSEERSFTTRSQIAPFTLEHWLVCQLKFSSTSIPWCSLILKCKKDQKMVVSFLPYKLSSLARTWFLINNAQSIYELQKLSFLVKKKKKRVVREWTEFPELSPATKQYSDKLQSLKCAHEVFQTHNSLSRKVRVSHGSCLEQKERRKRSD